MTLFYRNLSNYSKDDSISQLSPKECLTPIWASFYNAEEIPEIIDSPTTGLPAGRDKDNPPELPVNEPYKTHLAYVKERRTDKEAKQILEDALTRLRQKKGRA